MLVFDECIASGVVGMYDVFRQASAFLAREGAHAGVEPPGFDVEFVCAAPRAPVMGPVRVGPCRPMLEITATDLVIVPAVECDPAAFLAQHTHAARWIRERHEAGAEVASICTGAFLLAASGLVDGRACSTHWAAADRFAELFPAVRLEAQSIITDENGIYTCGGATSFYNLQLYIIEKYFGRDVALWLARMFLIELDRTSQNHFAVFEPRKRHGDREIVEIQRYIEENYARDIRVGELSERFGISRRTLIRRFKDSTGTPPIHYIQRARVEAAKKALESTADTVHEVMYAVGYNDLKFFRKLFRDVTGLTPAAYRKKYSQRWRGASGAARLRP